MPICGARTKDSHHEESSSSWLNAEPSENWFKRSITMYIIAMIPYLLQSLSISNWWSITNEFAYALEVAGAASFLMNSLYDLYVSILLGGFSFIDKTSSVAVANQQKRSFCNQLQTINWFFIGSLLYVAATVLYLAAPINYYYIAGGKWSSTKIVYIVAASTFVVHSLVCIVATIIGNISHQASSSSPDNINNNNNNQKDGPKSITTTTHTERKNFIRTWFFGRNKRMKNCWKYLDWFLLADLSFAISAIWDVLMITDTYGLDELLDQNGFFVSSIGWICNAGLYMIAAYSATADNDNAASSTDTYDHHGNDDDDRERDPNSSHMEEDNIINIQSTTTKLEQEESIELCHHHQEDSNNKNNYGAVVPSSVASSSHP